MPATAKIADLKPSLRGQLIEPEDPSYEEARALYNGMINKRPLAIARCADVADVIAAVNFGRDNALPIAIRGGGHNGPGLGSVEKGLVIDLSEMKGVRVDPATRTARVGAGCTQGDAALTSKPGTLSATVGTLGIDCERVAVVTSPHYTTNWDDLLCVR